MKLYDFISDEEVSLIIDTALIEDIRDGDVTTDPLVDPAALAEATIRAKEPCLISGATLAELVFLKVDDSLQIDRVVDEGVQVETGTVVMTISGSAASILKAERTALNYFQRLTGISTLTAQCVDRIKDTDVEILDTRKTTPGIRAFEKYAVFCGGGTNHRMGLYDMVLIKDNHKDMWKRRGGTLPEAIHECREKNHGIQVEIEIDNEEELKEALPGKPDWILLDNMSSEEMARCAELCEGICRTEASGGITIERLEEVAKTGIDAISLGCLTHSAPAADLSLRMVT